MFYQTKGALQRLEQIASSPFCDLNKLHPHLPAISEVPYAPIPTDFSLPPFRFSNRNSHKRHIHFMCARCSTHVNSLQL